MYSTAFICPLFHYVLCEQGKNKSQGKKGYTQESLENHRAVEKQAAILWTLKNKIFHWSQGRKNGRWFQNIFKECSGWVAEEQYNCN